MISCTHYADSHFFAWFMCFGVRVSYCRRADGPATGLERVRARNAAPLSGAVAVGHHGSARQRKTCGRLFTTGARKGRHSGAGVLCGGEAPECCGSPQGEWAQAPLLVMAHTDVVN